MLRWVSGTILGAPVVPPVGNSAAIFSGEGAASPPPSRDRRNRFAIERNATVERQRDDAFERGRQRLQPLDLLEQATGSARLFLFRLPVCVSWWGKTQGA